MLESLRSRFQPSTVDAVSSILAPDLMPSGFGRPALAALLREGSVVTEAGRLAVRRTTDRRERRRTAYVDRSAARQGEPVLLVPGFLAGDYTLRALATDLRHEGYRTYRSRILANVSCSLDAAVILEQRLEEIAERRGSRVQIVGHSLGGMLARGLAARRPDLVSGIVTMGSPMRAPAAHHRLLTGGVHVLTRLNRLGLPGFMSRDCVAGDCALQSFSEIQQPLRDGVAMTNIYSRRDGIVDWRACFEPDGTAVEVRASHVGMAVDPRVREVVVEALERHTAGTAWDEVSQTA